MDIDEEFRTGGGQIALVCRSTNGLSNGTEEEEAAGGQGECLACSDVNGLRGNVANAQAVDRRVVGHWNGAHSSIDIDVIRSAGGIQGTRR